MGKKLEESGNKKVLEYIVEEKVLPQSGKVTKVPRRRRGIRMSIWRGRGGSGGEGAYAGEKKWWGGG
jgi:hypothetical protein